MGQKKAAPGAHPVQWKTSKKPIQFQLQIMPTLLIKCEVHPGEAELDVGGVQDGHVVRGMLYCVKCMVEDAEKEKTAMALIDEVHASEQRPQAVSVIKDEDELLNVGVSA
jgi:hypothetical protein